MKFCDFYPFEYAQIKQQAPVPLLKIESDYTMQSSGQLLTRLEPLPRHVGAMAEGSGKKMGKGYFVGIDSGSTSTDVVILDRDGHIVTGVILPTGAGAAAGAERALGGCEGGGAPPRRRGHGGGVKRQWRFPNADRTGR